MYIICSCFYVSMCLFVHVCMCGSVDKAAQWVDAENENRDKYLSAQEKRGLEASQVRRGRAGRHCCSAPPVPPLVQFGG